MILDMTSYRNHGDEELAALYADADETAAGEIRAELARRDIKDAKHERDAARWAVYVAEWTEYAHAEYLAAVAATNGYLLSGEGKAAGIDEQALWSGPERLALRYASEELREFWAARPRMTVSEYHRAKRNERRDARRNAAGDN
jgi:hypothetical protein